MKRSQSLLSIKNALIDKQKREEGSSIETLKNRVVTLLNNSEINAKSHSNFNQISTNDFQLKFSCSSVKFHPENKQIISASKSDLLHLLFSPSSGLIFTLFFA